MKKILLIIIMLIVVMGCTGTTDPLVGTRYAPTGLEGEWVKTYYESNVLITNNHVIYNNNGISGLYNGIWYVNSDEYKYINDVFYQYDYGTETIDDIGDSYVFMTNDKLYMPIYWKRTSGTGYSGTFKSIATNVFDVILSNTNIIIIHKETNEFITNLTNQSLLIPIDNRYFYEGWTNGGIRWELVNDTYLVQSFTNFNTFYYRVTN